MTFFRKAVVPVVESEDGEEPKEKILIKPGLRLILKVVRNGFLAASGWLATLGVQSMEEISSVQWAAGFLLIGGAVFTSAVENTSINQNQETPATPPTTEEIVRASAQGTAEGIVMAQNYPGQT